MKLSKSNNPVRIRLIRDLVIGLELINVASGRGNLRPGPGKEI